VCVFVKFLNILGLCGPNCIRTGLPEQSTLRADMVYMGGSLSWQTFARTFENCLDCKHVFKLLSETYAFFKMSSICCQGSKLPR